MWSSATQQIVVDCHTDRSVVSAHRQKCGYLLTDKSVVIAHIQKCGHLLTDKSVVVCSETKVWLHARTISWPPCLGPATELLQPFPPPTNSPSSRRHVWRQCLHRRLSMCSAASTPLVNIPCFVSALSRHAVHTSQTSWLFLRQQAHTINFKTN